MTACSAQSAISVSREQTGLRLAALDTSAQKALRSSTLVLQAHIALLCLRHLSTALPASTAQLTESTSMPNARMVHTVAKLNDSLIVVPLVISALVTRRTLILTLAASPAERASTQVKTQIHVKIATPVSSVRKLPAHPTPETPRLREVTSAQPAVTVLSPRLHR
mgnify:CR=1 FL=1